MLTCDYAKTRTDDLKLLFYVAWEKKWEIRTSALDSPTYVLISVNHGLAWYMNTAVVCLLRLPDVHTMYLQIRLKGKERVNVLYTVEQPTWCWLTGTFTWLAFFSLFLLFLPSTLFIKVTRNDKKTHIGRNPVIFGILHWESQWRPVNCQLELPKCYAIYLQHALYGNKISAVVFPFVLCLYSGIVFNSSMESSEQACIPHNPPDNFFGTRETCREKCPKY